MNFDESDEMANSLRYYRKKENLTLQQLADLSGASRGHIANVETGSRKPTGEFIQKMCSALNISSTDLLAPPPGFHPERVREEYPSDYGKSGFQPGGVAGVGIAERIRLATKLKMDARELHALAERWEKEAETLERGSDIPPGN